MQHTHRAECECALCLHVRAYRHRRRRTRRIRGRTLLNSCSSGLRLMFGKTHTTKLAYSGLNSLATCQSELERSGGHNTLTHIATAAWEYCCGAHTTLYVTLSSWVCSRGLAPNLAASWTDIHLRWNLHRLYVQGEGLTEDLRRVSGGDEGLRLP